MTPPSNSSSSVEPLRSLTDRVRDRVAAAGQALDRRASAARPKGRRSRASASPPSEAAAVRHAASLRRVFLELGDTHRQYRRRTGQTATPPLREAAFAFKRSPSLDSLVAVSAFFDELGLLEW
jgi:hypothetical protein